MNIASLSETVAGESEDNNEFSDRAEGWGKEHKCENDRIITTSSYPPRKGSSMDGVGFVGKT